MEYRVGVLESDAQDLKRVVTDLRDFTINIRAWVRIIAVVWTMFQAILIALVVYYMTGHAPTP